MAVVTKPDPVRAPELDSLDGRPIRHGFFTRAGGVSEGIYRGLNVGLGSSDDPALVAENRRRVTDWLGVAAERLVTPYQVHSPDVVTVSAPFEGERPKADAIVTATPGLAVGVHTADCGPVLFADTAAGVVGAAHAGWKGALTGVLENTVSAMEKLGADRTRIVAVLGPSITAANYEVGPEFVQRFRDAHGGDGRWFTSSARAGHAMFDLTAYTVERLVKAGVSASFVGHCTYAREDLYFSYRRTTHRREPDYGRQVSAIVIPE